MADPAGFVYLEPFLGIVQLQTGGQKSSDIVAPFKGRVRAMTFHGFVAIAGLGGVGNTVKVLINGVDSGEFRAPEGQAQNTGLRLGPDNAHNIYFNAGDLIQAETNGEQIAGGSAQVAWVLEPT